MSKIFRNQSSVRLPKSSKVIKRDEYGKEKEGITKCPDCGNIHFKKRWYASLNDIKDKLKELRPRIARRDRCPACVAINGRVFAGELVINNIPEDKKYDLTNLINNFAKQAKERDPQDRIIFSKGTRTSYRLTTTDNQMVNKLAKKIKGTFKTDKPEVAYSKEPYEVTRVQLSFI